MTATVFTSPRFLYAAADAARFLVNRCNADITGAALTEAGFRLEVFTRRSGELLIVANAIYTAPDERSALRVSVENGSGRPPTCEGHEPGQLDPMGQTVYCDGKCNGPASRTATLRTVDDYSSAALSALEGLCQAGSIL